MKVVPNPEFAMALYEYRFFDRNGKELDFPHKVRGNRIEDGEIVDVVPEYIVIDDEN